MNRNMILPLIILSVAAILLAAIPMIYGGYVARKQTELKAIQCSVDSLAADKQQYGIEIQTLQEEIQRTSFKVDSLERTAVKLEAVNRKAQDEVDAETAKLSNLKAESQKICKKNANLKALVAGLEIAFDSVTAEEVPFLSQPLRHLDIRANVLDSLALKNIFYVGDLVQQGERHLARIRGIGDTTMQTIKDTLSRHDCHLGMAVVNVDRHWFKITKKD